MANRGYAYTTEHAPLDLNLPLWKLKANRPAEWQGIINALEGSPKEVFTTIISVPEVQSFLDCTYFPSGHQGAKEITPSEFLNELCEYRSKSGKSSDKKPSALTFGWLFEICLLSDISLSSGFITLLRELQDTYKPLEIINESVRINGQGFEATKTEYLVTVDLGSTLEVEIHADGVPEVVYEWFKLPSEQEGDVSDIGDQDWSSLGVKTRTLRIENFRLSDIGAYRCYINHRIPVAYTAKALNNGLKPSRPSLNDNSSFVHGMWSQSFDVRACPGSILIIKSPKALEHGLVGGSILLECEAEIAPDIRIFKGKTDTAELQYRWYHDGIELIGQTKPFLLLNQLWLESAGNYFCRVSGSHSSNEKRNNKDIDCSKGYRDSNICVMKVALPTNEEITNGDVEFSNEEIIILKHPDLSTNLESTNENDSLSAPASNEYTASRRAAIGDKVSLSCTAVCKYALKYEWLKQGIRRDLVSEPRRPDVYLAVNPVAFGSQLDDEIDENERVSAWTYRCAVTCPTTGQRIQSRSVTIEVSTFARTPEKSLPSFKIALVICQEVYVCSKYFPPLMAPKQDGMALISALRQLDFQVLAFSNLTMDELKSAVDTFCAFIDRNTYALFYYNGHAIGHGNDVYLVSKDTDFKENNMSDDDIQPPDEEKNGLSDMKLLWHGEIEEKLDRANPLLCTMIYDSCRSAPPQSVANTFRAASSKRRDLSILSSNFFFAYGTRPSMKSYEKVVVDYGSQLNKLSIGDVADNRDNQKATTSSPYERLERRISYVSQGLYMKHLLKHLTTPNLTISEIFARLYSSFTQEEDLSVLDSQRPEVKQSTEPFRLDAPLRRSACTRLHKLFFNMTRYEATASFATQPGLSESSLNSRNPLRSAFDPELKYDLGLKWILGPSNVAGAESLTWITGNTPQTPHLLKYNSCDNLLRVKVMQEPNGFNNEASLVLSLIGPRAKFETITGLAIHLIAIQLIPCNLELTSNNLQDSQQLDVKFDPCLKKAVRGAEGFLPTDGPLFKIASELPGFHSSNDELILGRCRIINLQTVISDLKLRAILHFQDKKMMCPSGGDGSEVKYGVMKFALPIIRNYPRLKMNNTVYHNT